MFKFNENKKKKAVSAFLKNPLYKEIYENVPSHECREYWEYIFYTSEYDDIPEKEEIPVRDSIYDALSADDWKYIKKYTNGPMLGVIDRYIKKLESK